MGCDRRGAQRRGGRSRRRGFPDHVPRARRPADGIDRELRRRPDPGEHHDRRALGRRAADLCGDVSDRRRRRRDRMARARTATRFNAGRPTRRSTPESVWAASPARRGGTRAGRLPVAAARSTVVALNVTSDAAVGPRIRHGLPVRSRAPWRPRRSTSSLATPGPTTRSSVSATAGCCIYSSTSTEIIVDLVGYLASDRISRTYPPPPTRLLDTRDTVGYLAPAADGVVSSGSPVVWAATRPCRQPST